MAEGGIKFVDTMTGRIAMLEAGVGARAKAAMESMVDDIVAYARGNAPWADRTGAAREGLDADVHEEGAAFVLDLYHSVDYGQWLETIQNGRFAIIMDTLEIYAPQVFARAGAYVIGEER